MDEMISTEREYVRSLSYIMEHYFPEMERPDLPQDLRGKRSIIFGNLEKLCDFHSQYFLKDLEQCAHSPLSVSTCFLRHVSRYTTHPPSQTHVFFWNPGDVGGMCGSVGIRKVITNKQHMCVCLCVWD